MKFINNISVMLSALTIGLILINFPLVKMNFWIIDNYLSNFFGIVFLLISLLGFVVEISNLTKQLDEKSKEYFSSFFVAIFLLTLSGILWWTLGYFNVLFDIFKLLIIIPNLLSIYGLYQAIIGIIYVISENAPKGFELLLKVGGLIIAIVSLVLTI